MIYLSLIALCVSVTNFILLCIIFCNAKYKTQFYVERFERINTDLSLQRHKISCIEMYHQDNKRDISTLNARHEHFRNIFEKLPTKLWKEGKK